MLLQQQQQCYMIASAFQTVGVATAQHDADPLINRLTTHLKNCWLYSSATSLLPVLAHICQCKGRHAQTRSAAPSGVCNAFTVHWPLFKATGIKQQVGVQLPAQQ
jgi:hypothetical protein